MELEDVLNEFECYRRIQGFEILDRILPIYLRNAELGTPSGEPNQGREVRLMIGKSDLSSRSVIFHEKCEIGAYLDFGYSEEDVKNGKAHREAYREAHEIAEKLELQLLQHVAKRVFGKALPLFTIFPTRPVTQLFDPELKVIDSRMDFYLPHNSYFGLAAGIEVYKPMVFDQEQVDQSFQMFEHFGSKYPLEGFKERALVVVEDFVRRTNKKYQQPEEDTWQAPKSQPIVYGLR